MLIANSNLIVANVLCRVRRKVENLNFSSRNYLCEFFGGNANFDVRLRFVLFGFSLLVDRWGHEVGNFNCHRWELWVSFIHCGLVDSAPSYMTNSILQGTDVSYFIDWFTAINWKHEKRDLSFGGEGSIVCSQVPVFLPFHSTNMCSRPVLL